MIDKKSHNERQRAEFTERQIEQIDAIDNAVYETILTFLSKTEDEFPWDMYYIGEVAEAIEETLLAMGERVHRPAILAEPDGTSYIEEYQEPKKPDRANPEKKEAPAHER